MNENLKIGEIKSLGMLPYYFPLKNLFKDEGWEFIDGTQKELDNMIETGQVDIAPVSPLLLCSSPGDYYVFQDIGYAARRHVKDVLFFSDILLDDMDEMTVSIQKGSVISWALMNIILGRYLQYQNHFTSGWDGAEAHVLAGDSALRERTLARYSYVYDVGDLWRHYTGVPLIYHLWAVRKESLRKREDQVNAFYKAVKHGLSVSSSDWSRLSSLIDKYNWIKKSVMNQVWMKVEYELQPEHFEGLYHFYDDCIETGLIEDLPEIEYFEQR